MPPLIGHNITIRNYKSFASDGGCFEDITPINIIIGRNNSGKSALIDSIEYALLGVKVPETLNHSGQPAELIYRSTLTEGILRPVFQSNRSGGSIPGNHWAFGCKLIGETAEVSINGTDRALQSVSNGINLPDEIRNHLVRTIPDPFRNINYHRLAAERDVNPEADKKKLEITKNGAGLSQTIARIYNNAAYDRSLVEAALLEALNRIFQGDAKFTRILVRQLNDDRWEIFLDEEQKGSIPISASGSGLKTAMLVAAFVEVLPAIKDMPLNTYALAFEELENNLHPALQRRLFSYLRAVAVDRGATLFITTHSSTVIDLFSSDNSANIIHVRHDGEKSSARRVRTYVEHGGILDDLDIRASDLLQANGVVWVEGPSDRIYFNRWIHLHTNGELQEGLHYQCIFYGGRLLSHLYASDPGQPSEDAVKILRVNRNAIILMDSDKNIEADDVNDTKRRVVEEIASMNGISWITSGREVENYLTSHAIAALFPSVSRELGQFEDIAEFLSAEASMEDGRRFNRTKALYAERLSSYLTTDDLRTTLDWSDRMSTVVNAIRKWNQR